MGEQVTPDAGWYADPDDAEALRYFDGQRWTDHRSPQPLSSEATLEPVDTAANPRQSATPAWSAIRGWALAAQIASLVVGLAGLWWQFYATEIQGDFNPMFGGGQGGVNEFHILAWGLFAAAFSLFCLGAGLRRLARGIDRVLGG